MILIIILSCVSIAVLAALVVFSHRMWTRVWSSYGQTMEQLKDECPDAHDMLGDMLADGGHDPEMYNRHMAKVAAGRDAVYPPLELDTPFTYNEERNYMEMYCPYCNAGADMQRGFKVSDEIGHWSRCTQCDKWHVSRTTCQH